MQKITLLKGDGIGPEIVTSVLAIFDKLQLPIEFDEQLLGQAAIEAYGDPLPPETLASIKANKTVLKAPYKTEVASGFRSVNVSLRQQLQLYANLRPIDSTIFGSERYGPLNFAILRENTEDLYVGEEQVVKADQEVTAIKRITRLASQRIIKYAFDYARSFGFTKVTCVHKANILKLSDGLFLTVFQEIAADYPDIKADDLIVDNAALQLVINPQQFQVLVMPNLYGDILSDLASGLIGGLGLAPSANIGEHYALFEACHGCAPDLAGKNLANPSALILSACLMLEHLGYNEAGTKIKAALQATLASGAKTADLGGQLGTSEFTSALLSFLHP